MEFSENVEKYSIIIRDVKTQSLLPFVFADFSLNSDLNKIIVKLKSGDEIGGKRYAPNKIMTDNNQIIEINEKEIETIIYDTYTPPTVFLQQDTITDNDLAISYSMRNLYAKIESYLNLYNGKSNLQIFLVIENSCGEVFEPEKLFFLQTKRYERQNEEYTVKSMAVRNATTSFSSKESQISNSQLFENQGKVTIRNGTNKILFRDYKNLKTDQYYIFDINKEHFYFVNEMDNLNIPLDSTRVFDETQSIANLEIGTVDPIMDEKSTKYKIKGTTNIYSKVSKSHSHKNTKVDINVKLTNKSNWDIKLECRYEPYKKINDINSNYSGKLTRVNDDEWEFSRITIKKGESINFFVKIYYDE